MPSPFKQTLVRLSRDQSGLAMVEFAISLPFFIGLTVGGVEIANYASIVMQLNQIALHTADNAARIGTRTPNADRIITETQINDVFAGAMREGKRIKLAANTLIILSSFEGVVPFSTTLPRYRIRWQRCGGEMTSFRSNYGTPNDTTSVTGIGPAGRQVSPPPGGSLMFVELQYQYKPMIVNGFTRITDHTIDQVASMVVRDARDLVGPAGGNGIYNNENATASLCTTP